MRITIEIDGVEMAETTVRSDVTAAVFPRATVAPTEAPGVYAAAADLGAEDAGPAPVEPAAWDVPTVPSRPTDPGAPAAEPCDAGPAPEAALTEEDE